MTVDPNPQSTPNATDGAVRLLSPLESFARSISGRDNELGAQLYRCMDTVRNDVSLVLREHAGLSDELLRVYEQIGIVFDVTRKLMSLRDEEEVEHYLAGNLRITYPDIRCAVARCNRSAPTSCSDTPPSICPGGLTLDGDIDYLPVWVIAAVCEACESRRVCVANETDRSAGAGPDDAPLPEDQVLVAPLFAGDEFVSALLLWRPAGGPRWESGDMLLLDSLAAFCGDVIRNFRLVRELQQMSMDMVRSLVNAVDQKDPYTSGHTNRVSYYATLLGAELGFDAETLRTLEWSALLHDVGKIGIRDDVLKKTGKLSDEEFEHIKEHPLRGYEVVRENPHMRDAVDGVRYHHERWNGTGYPEGLIGEAIPFQARIIQIADIFDALTSTRSYRGAFPWRKALEILREEAGTVVDPQLQKTFDAMMLRFYEQNPEAFDEIGKADARLQLTPPVEPDEEPT